MSLQEALTMVLTLAPLTRVPTQTTIEDIVAKPGGCPFLEAAQVDLLKFLIASTACETSHEAKTMRLTIAFTAIVNCTSVKMLDSVTVFTNKSQDTSHCLFV